LDTQRSPEDNPAVTQALKLLHSTFDRNIYLDELAETVGLSKFYLLRLIKLKTGQTTRQLHLKVRVQHARKLLLQGHSVNDAAKKCGFVDSSHLTRHYKRIVGETPGETKPVD
jgi:transcriptional regulator GlxA family with amidase domain